MLFKHHRCQSVLETKHMTKIWKLSLFLNSAKVLSSSRSFSAVVSWRITRSVQLLLTTIQGQCTKLYIIIMILFSKFFKIQNMKTFLASILLMNYIIVKEILYGSAVKLDTVIIQENYIQERLVLVQMAPVRLSRSV